jgi:NAD(P)-dependent dehydrogenase (short-subunit alcohol dehydrogenase family)
VREAFESKFWGQYFAAKYAVPYLRPGGSIVFITGVYGHRPPKGRHVLAAMNGGIEGLARALAVDLAPLRVNVVAPGMMDTPLYADMPADQRQAMYDELAARLPVGRIGTAEDAAKAILYLMDDGYVTGTVLHVDGGLSLR